MKPTVAIFGKPRTGTGSMFAFLCALGMDLVHEPFHPGKWPHRYDIGRELETLYAAHDGMKHLHAHVSREANLQLPGFLRRRGVPILHMRRNEFWAALSEVLATQTGFWGCEPDRREEYVARVAGTELDVGRLRWMIGHYERENAVYDAELVGPDVLRIVYDEFYQGEPDRRQAVLEEIIRRVGLTVEPGWQALAEDHFARHHKQNTPDVYARIPNRTEVEAEFGVSLGD